METQNIIILIVAVIIGILLIRFVAKVLFKVIIFLALVAAICYLIFFYKGGIKNSGDKKNVLYELQDRYCKEKFDTIKCDCIINPLINDLTVRYKPDEIMVISKDPGKSAEIIVKLLNENKTEIKECLKEKNATYVWEDFIKDLKSLKLGDRFRTLIDALNTESKTQ